MKTVIVAINSKYIHASLAPWYLKAACGPECGEVCVLEHTINETVDTILASVFSQHPDVAAFSCYIWNVTYALKLAASLKKLLPGTAIVFGGPEASFEAENLIGQNPFIDYVLSGEGEISFPKLLRSLTEGNPALDKIAGLLDRNGNSAGDFQPAVIENLDQLPSPYTTEMLSAMKNRIIYFEASRGCPFSCSYCLSSAAGGTRFFSLERVFRELDKLVAAGVRQIKFVDRTFNCNQARAMAIIRHILEMNAKARTLQNGRGVECNFHFEVGADLFDEEFLKLLKKAPSGLFQLEAGVQTTNLDSLEAVNRKTDLRKLFNNLKEIKKAGNVHIHADLIAGLPYEDYRSFAHSFDRVFDVRPHQLQLGFLKFLKGTGMREHAAEAGYIFADYPPYEILSGRSISFEELIVLKGIAELVERCYNSVRFIYSMEYLIKIKFKSPFHFFELLLSYYSGHGLLDVQAGVRELYAIFDRFASEYLTEEEQDYFRELLRLDFLASDNSGTLPEFLERHISHEFQSKCFDFLKGKDSTQFIPEAAEMPSKQLYKKVRFMPFKMELPPEIPLGKVGENADNSKIVQAQKRESRNTGNISGDSDEEFKTILLFNYLNRDRVTGRYPFYSISF